MVRPIKRNDGIVSGAGACKVTVMTRRLPSACKGGIKITSSLAKAIKRLAGQS